MKKFKLLILIFPALALLAGCSQETDYLTDDPSGSEKIVTIKATVPQAPTTKVAFSGSSDDDYLSLSWQEGDCIRIMSGTQSQKYKIAAGFEPQVAQFYGTDVTGVSYNILYPGTCAGVPEAENFDFAAQVQNGNDNPEHLRYFAYLQGVDTKDDICFSADWAADHGGDFHQSGVVKWVLTLPSEVTAATRVALRGLSKEIAVDLQNATIGSDHVLTAYALTPWTSIPIAEGTNLFICVTDQNGTMWCRKIVIPEDTYLQSGVMSIFYLSHGFEAAQFQSGDGTKDNPYLIANATHLNNMHAAGIMLPGQKVWFKLAADVDASSIADWEPLNHENPYTCEVDFNGNGHAINNLTCKTTEACPGFFTVLFGDVHDLTISNAVIEKTDDSNGHPCGILAGYLGYGGKPAHVWNVHVSGSVNSKNVNGVGGLCGRIQSALVESCSADCNIVSAKKFTGGIFGYDAGMVTVRNCWTSGTISAIDAVGGIAGGTIKMGTVISNCFSTMAIDAKWGFGGIAGMCNMDKADQVDSRMPNNVFSKCIAWNPYLKSYVDEESITHYSSGAVVGFTATHNYLTACLRRPDMEFKDYSTSYNFQPYDQNDASPTTALVIQGPSGTTHHYAYHGKAVAAGKTLSDAARQLGWSETVWDLSGSVPVLTGAIEDSSISSGAVNVPSGPSSLRGKGEIRPSGTGWTHKQIEIGLDYYKFSGTESVTGKAQEIFVIDLDLNNPNFAVKFVAGSASAPCNELFEAYNAVAAINGAYERGSVVVKADGVGLSSMPNDYIYDDSRDLYIPNWKSEAAVYCDGNRKVKISFDGYDMSIAQQRQYYMNTTDQWDNIFTSAPMLISDFYPVGESFVSTWKSKRTATASTEEPSYHQNVLHPRTAIALTEGNHLILMVVDGRSSYSNGMSARQLTQFLANNFNPQYALNLDGGGSSTMCVRGEGASTTNIVNYPCDNNKHDHAGARSVNSHICIVKTE
ncbi:MAG: phosphodiester glycosidase family protein [Bacteroidales bacterium]|nr:phosphodiester glycosidase family protein [Bacteroidales bacterium]